MKWDQAIFTLKCLFDCPDSKHVQMHTCLSKHFLNRPSPASLSFNFAFANKHYNFNVKKCPSSIRDWDLNSDLWNMSLLRQPLDKSSRPRLPKQDYLGAT